MAAWEAQPNHERQQFLTLRGKYLHLNRKFLSFANPKELPYVSVRIDPDSFRIGVAFHGDPGDPGDPGVYSAACQKSSSGKAYDSGLVLNVSKLISAYKWIAAVAAATPDDLGVLSLQYSSQEKLWVACLPFPLEDTFTRKRQPSWSDDAAGLLCFLRGEVVLGVIECPFRKYMEQQRVQRSFWTACRYAVITDPSRRKSTVTWWRRFYRCKQDGLLPNQSGAGLKWSGKCRSEWDILKDHGWSDKAIDSLIDEDSKELGINLDQIFSIKNPPIDDGYSAALSAMRSQLTALEIQEAEESHIQERADNPIW